MVKRRVLVAAVLVGGCANIWGFEDLSAPPPPPPPVYCAGSIEPCPTGCSACTSRCVDLKTDPLNCGSCGTQCTSGRMCEAGACVCAEGTEVCGGLCTNVDSDVMNCGACGVACDPGGACNQGVCTAPVVLTTGQGTAGTIVTDGTRLYFSSGTGIYSMAKDGSDLVTLATPGLVVTLAVDAESLYYRGVSIEKIPLAGGTPTVLVATTTGGALTVDSTSVYYAETGTVNKVPIEGGSPTVLTTGTASPNAIVVDANSVYFSYSYDVYRTPLAGGSVMLLGSAPTPISDLELGGAFVYYAGGYVGALALDGSTSRQLSTRGGATKLAIDADNAYFFEGSVLERVPLAGGGVPTTLATDMYPVDLVVDDTSVYWTSRGADLTSGAVTMVAK